MTGLTSGLLAQESTSVYHEFARFHSMTEWWHWMAFVFITFVVLGWIIYMYIRDTAELSMGIRIALLLLRVFAFLGIIFYFIAISSEMLPPVKHIF